MNHSITTVLAGSVLFMAGSLAAGADTHSVAARLYGQDIEQSVVDAAAEDGQRVEALTRIVQARRTRHLLSRFAIEQDDAALSEYLHKRYPEYFSDGTVDAEIANYVALRDGLNAVLSGGQSVVEVFPQVSHVVPTFDAWRAMAGNASDSYVASLDRLIERSAEERDAERLALLKPAYETQRIRDAICQLDDVHQTLEVDAARIRQSRLPGESNFEKRQHEAAVAHCWLAAASWLREHTRESLTIVDQTLMPAEELLYTPDPVEARFRRGLN